MAREVPRHRAPPHRRLLPVWRAEAQASLPGRSGRRLGALATPLPSGRMKCGVVKRVSAGFVAVVLLLVACGCGRDGSDSAGNSFGEGGSTALPVETAQDWVTYTDYLVEVTVISERPIPTATSSVPATAGGRSVPAATSSGDGFLHRQVTATTSSPPVWARPTLVRTRLLPASITLNGGGWVVHGTDRKPSRLVNQTRPEIGRHYLAAITYANLSIAGGDGSGPTEWVSLAQLPFDQGVVGEVPAVSGDSMPKSFEGKRAAEVAAVLTRTPADPAAARYMAEDPVQRFRDVARDTQPSGTPAPGEH